MITQEQRIASIETFLAANHGYEIPQEPMPSSSSSSQPPVTGTVAKLVDSKVWLQGGPNDGWLSAWSVNVQNGVKVPWKWGGTTVYNNGWWVSPNIIPVTTEVFVMTKAGQQVLVPITTEVP